MLNTLTTTKLKLSIEDKWDLLFKNNVIIENGKISPIN